MEADAEHGDAQLAVDLAQLLEMFVHLVAGLVQGLERRAREFELAAGLERDVGAAFACQRDDVFALIDGFPSEPLEPLEQVADPGGAIVGERRVIGLPEGELLVLRADAPGLARLLALGEPRDELFLGFDDGAAP